VSAANTPISLEFSNDVRVAMIIVSIVSILLDLMVIISRVRGLQTIDCCGRTALLFLVLFSNFSMSGCHIDPLVVEKEKKKGKREKIPINFYIFFRYDALFGSTVRICLR